MGLKRRRRQVAPASATSVIITLLGLWLVTTPFILGAPGPKVARSGIVSGVLTLICSGIVCFWNFLKYRNRKPWGALSFRARRVLRAETYNRPKRLLTDRNPVERGDPHRTGSRHRSEIAVAVD